MAANLQRSASVADSVNPTSGAGAKFDKTVRITGHGRERTDPEREMLRADPLECVFHVQTSQRLRRARRGAMESAASVPGAGTVSRRRTQRSFSMVCHVEDEPWST